MNGIQWESWDKWRSFLFLGYFWDIRFAQTWRAGKSLHLWMVDFPAKQVWSQEGSGMPWICPIFLHTRRFISPFGWKRRKRYQPNMLHILGEMSMSNERADMTVLQSCCNPKVQIRLSMVNAHLGLRRVVPLLIVWRSSFQGAATKTNLVAAMPSARGSWISRIKDRMLMLVDVWWQVFDPLWPWKSPCLRTFSKNCGSSGRYLRKNETTHS